MFTLAIDLVSRAAKLKTQSVELELVYMDPPLSKPSPLDEIVLLLLNSPRFWSTNYQNTPQHEIKIVAGKQPVRGKHSKTKEARVVAASKPVGKPILASPLDSDLLEPSQTWHPDIVPGTCSSLSKTTTSTIPFSTPSS